MKTVQFTLLFALIAVLAACGSTSSSGNSRSATGDRVRGDSLWAQLDRSRRQKERRNVANAGRQERLEAGLARGRSQVPADQRRKMERWWKEFLADQEIWLQSRLQWRALGAVPQDILVENLIVTVVRAFEANQGRLYKRARAELFELREPAIPYLVSGLIGNHGDDFTRLRCVEVLSDFGPSALPALENSFADVSSDDARLNLVRVVAAMGEYGAPRSLGFLAPIALDDGNNFRIRLTAIEGLGASRDGSAINPLVKCLRDDDLSVRKFSAAALANFRERRVAGALVEAMADAERGRARNQREAEVIANCQQSLAHITGRRYRGTKQWQAWWRETQ